MALKRIWLMVLVVVALQASQSAQGAILNSLRGFSGEEDGWAGSVSGSFGASGGNTEETSFATAMQVQLRVGDDLFRLMGNGKRSSSKGEETARAITGHLRHNHRLNHRFSTLAFIQVQENPFQHLESRTLLGVGGRCTVLSRNGREIALGMAHMWEAERLDGQDGRRDEQRLSAFASVVLPLRDGLELDTLAFFQPAWSDLDDLRLFWQLSLKVELTGTLSLFTGWQLEHDSRPADGVERTDWESTTGFSVGF